MQSISFASRVTPMPRSNPRTVPFSGLSGQRQGVRHVSRPVSILATLAAAGGLVLALAGCAGAPAPDATSTQQTAEATQGQLTPDQAVQVKAHLANLEKRFKPGNIQSIQWQNGLSFKETDSACAIITTQDGQQYKLSFYREEPALLSTAAYHESPPVDGEDPILTPNGKVELRDPQNMLLYIDYDYVGARGIYFLNTGISLQSPSLSPEDKALIGQSSDFMAQLADQAKKLGHR